MNKVKIKEELRAMRKQMFDEMEEKLCAGKSPKDSMFYYHPSEERIVLSHALFRVMTQSVKGKIAREKFFLLLRQYQEEMLEAYLTEDAYFPELLRYCNIIYDTLPMIIQSLYDINTDKEARKLGGILIVASGYGGDMPEDLANELLDDMDFHYNKVKCRKIEQMLPRLNQLVAEEMV